MARYVDASGNLISLGERLGEGGEGAVHAVHGNGKTVAKVYRKPLTTEHAAKLQLMAQLGHQEVLKVAAWPVTTLHDGPQGRVVGVVMPRIERGREVHELYSPAHRKMHFPNADWRFLIRTAHNCAAAFDLMHRRGIVIGDVNQGNVFVVPDATVRLIDCDSFQIQSAGHTFRCKVGVPHFTPPELQNARFTEVVRTPNHDNFGLAVLIFHLLFMGRHPFAGRYNGPGDMPIEKAITECRFAYSVSNNKTGMSPPPYSLAVAEVSQDLISLYERAFSRQSSQANGRPTAQEWGKALSTLESRLRQCSDDLGHYFTAGKTCPWCRIFRDGGPNFFISVSLKIDSSRPPFDVVKIWATIEAIARPGLELVTPLQYSTAHLRPVPLPDTSDDHENLRRTLGWIAVGGTALSLFGLIWHLVALFAIPNAIIFAAWWCYERLNQPLRRELRHRTHALQKRQHDLEVLKRKINASVTTQRRLFDGWFSQLRDYRREYDQLQSLRNQEYAALQSTARERQLEDYLRQCFISKGKIKGIGAVRVATLESYGIETAFDVTGNRVMSVPGFGPSLTTELLNWRAAKERQFRFDASKGAPQSAVQALDMKYAQRRTRIELELTKGPRELQQIVSQARSVLQQFSREYAEREIAIAQAKCDLTVFP